MIVPKKVFMKMGQEKLILGAKFLYLYHLLTFKK